MTLASAEAALAAAKSEPAIALDAARQLREDFDGEVAAVAGWACGVACFELGANDQALVWLRQAVREAADERRSRVLVSLAAAVAASGETNVAKGILNDAAADPDPVVTALAISQLGMLEVHSGELRAGLALLESALPALAADPRELAALTRVLGNTGACLMMLDRLHESNTYHWAALRGAEATGQKMCVAGSYQNLGYTEMRLGNFPQALHHLHQARHRYGEMGAAARRNLGTLYDDLAETYRMSGLLDDAIEYARRSAEVVQSGGNMQRLHDARLREARCLLDAGHLTDAAQLAASTAEDFWSTGRPVQARRAELVAIEAASSEAGSPVMSVENTEQAAAELADAGWAGEALALLNRGAEAALDDGLTDVAEALLARPVEPGGQAVAFQLEALYRRVMTRRSRSQDPAPVLREALQVLAKQRASMVDPELRANAIRLSARFRHVAIGQALNTGSASELLLAEETWRATSVEVHPTVERSERWRELVESLRDATAASNGSHVPATSNLQKVRQLEEELRTLSRTTQATSVYEVAGHDFSEAALRSRLGDRPFISLIPHGDVLHGIAVQPGDGVHHWIAGDRASLRSDVQLVLDLLGQLLRVGLSDAARASIQVEVMARAASLGEQLVPVVLNPAPGIEVIVSPPLELLNLPWSLLVPDGRAITVAPSATRWIGRGNIDPQRATVVVGPGLGRAAIDRDAFASTFPAATSVCGHAATSDALIDSLERSSIVHIACHGSFRSDSPQFSTLELGDGTSTLFDLDQLQARPDLVVLAACEAGTLSVPGQSELVGTTGALLSAGTRCVIAPALAIPDDETGHVMAQFYRALLGRTPSQALAAIRSSSARSTQLWATSHALQCVGSDLSVVSTSPV